MTHRSFVQKIRGLLIVVVAALAVFLILGVVFGIMRKRADVEPKKELFYYKYLRFHPDVERREPGKTTLPHPLKDGYLTLQDEKGFFSITSEFGSTEYCCTGTCYCDSERRTSGTLTIKGLSWVVAAFSTVAAYKLAKDHFDTRCRYDLYDTCDAPNVRSESECECGCGHSDTKEKCEGHAQGVQIQDSPDYIKTKYICKGRCIPRNVHYDYEMEVDSGKSNEAQLQVTRDHLSMLSKQIEDFECTRLELSKEIIEDIPADLKKNEVHERIHVETEFTRKYLSPYCTEKSMELVEYTIRQKPTTFRKSMCTGKNRKNNPTVICVKM